MVRSRTVVVSFARALPPNEPLARLMGRLLVLRADFEMEYPCISGDEGVEVLDKFDEMYRRLYFIRGNSRTLYSGFHLLKALQADPTFRGWLRAAAESERQEWESAFTTFKKAMRHIESLRNEVGAHAEHDIEPGIRSMPPGTTGMLELDGVRLRPRLASKILLSAMLPGVPESEWSNAFKARLTKVAEANRPFLSATNIAFNLYAQHFPAIIGR